MDSPPPISPPPALHVQPAPPTYSVERTVQIGLSTENRPIVMHLFGTGDHPIFIMAGIHGNEQNSSECITQFLEYVRSNRGQFANLPLAIIPAANPDGLQRGVRVNARRVDLNRNFPALNWEASKFKGPYFGGPSAASEPETAALAQTISRLQPRRILTVHSMRQPCDNYDGPAEQIARSMAEKNGYPVTANIGYPTPGSLGSWAGIDQHIPVITLELPSQMPGELCWQQNREAILTFVRG